MPASEP